MITDNAVWLITGCSKGLGRALAEQAAARPHPERMDKLMLVSPDGLASPGLAYGVALARVPGPIERRVARPAATLREVHIEGGSLCGQRCSAASPSSVRR